jgi:hypothetical protein
VSPSLLFVTPAWQRYDLTRLCLWQLRLTCDALAGEGLTASAIVIADDENLDTAREFGFGTIERDNRATSAKYNDGIQLACDPELNPRPADYVVPIGSDDWVDHRILLDLPPLDTIYGFQRLSFVRPDGREMVQRFVNVRGGCGIRIYPRQVFEKLHWRPADEDRKRACDTSIITNLWREVRPRIMHLEIDPKQIVDWKSPDVQLNPYDSLTFHRAFANPQDPFEALQGWYPDESLRAMAEHYSRARELVA